MTTATWRYTNLIREYDRMRCDKVRDLAMNVEGEGITRLDNHSIKNAHNTPLCNQRNKLIDALNLSL